MKTSRTPWIYPENKAVRPNLIYSRRYINQAVMDKTFCCNINCDAHMAFCSDKMKDQEDNYQALPCDIWKHTDLVMLLTGEELYDKTFE